MTLGSRCRLSTTAAPEGLRPADAVQGYRRLLRSAVDVFGSDVDAIYAARAQLKGEFRKQQHVTDPKELKALFAGTSTSLCLLCL